jgi:LacI family transcriptional regulator
MGEYPIGSALPSERLLSEKLLASRTIIRAAILELTDSGHLSSRPRCRPVVLEPPTTRTKAATIAVRLWPSTSDFIASQILRGIQRAAPEGTRFVVANVGDGDWTSHVQSEVNFLNSLSSDPAIGGAILWFLGGEANRTALAKLKSSGMPIVLIDRESPPSCPTDFVGTHNFRAAQKATDHLIRLGHERIAIFSNCDNASTVRDRENGYRRALSEARIPFDYDLFFRDTVDDPVGVEEGIDRMLTLSNPPTALFCINDHIALQAYEALTARGISIPSSISIIGFDGLLRWIPGGGYLTSMHQDFERMGEIAIELITQRAQFASSVYRHVLLDSELKEQGSTAKPAAKSTAFFATQ